MGVAWATRRQGARGRQFHLLPEEDKRKVKGGVREVSRGETAILDDNDRIRDIRTTPVGPKRKCRRRRRHGDDDDDLIAFTKAFVRSPTSYCKVQSARARTKTVHAA